MFDDEAVARGMANAETQRATSTSNAQVRAVAIHRSTGLLAQRSLVTQLAEKTARVTRRCSLERLTIARVANKQIQDICGQCPREIPAPEKKARRVVFEITATLTSASSECAAEFVLRAYLSVDA